MCEKQAGRCRKPLWDDLVRKRWDDRTTDGSGDTGANERDWREQTRACERPCFSFVAGFCVGTLPTLGLFSCRSETLASSPQLNICPLDQVLTAYTGYKLFKSMVQLKDDAIRRAQCIR